MSKILKSNSKKILSVIMALVLVFGVMANYAFVGAAEEGWTNVSLKDPNLYYHGRTFDISGGSVGIDWSSSGVSFNVKATDIKMTFAASGSPWIQVFVDGEKTKRISIGNGEYEIATGLNPEKVTEIKVVNSSESNFNFAAISKISIKGELAAIERKDYKIEVIGDSISAGQWMTASSDATVFRLEEEDSTRTYGALLADKFDADFTLLASSGAGVYVDSSGLKSGEVNTDNKPANIWADMYEHAVTARSARGVARGIKSEDWDFTNDNPDLIIVNLGTNDASKAPKEAGTELDEFNNGVTTAVGEFLTLLTAKHPNAKIVWCYGIMNKTLTTVIKTAVENFAKTNSNVSFIELPAQGTFSNTTGGGNHPNAETHAKLADYLFDRISAAYKAEARAEIDYTVPVLTTETVTGNTIYSSASAASTSITAQDNLNGNTGIHYEWAAGAGSGVRNGIYQKFGFDGISVKVANVGDNANPGSRRFALYFTTNKDHAYSGQKIGLLRIKFDGVQNKVFADLDGSSYTVIENAEIFTAMPDNTVYVDINKAENQTDYVLTVIAGDVTASGIIPASHLSGFSLDEDGKCYTLLAAVNITGQKVTTIDYLGVTNLKEISENVLEYKSAATANDLNNLCETTSAAQGIKLTVRAATASGLGKGVDLSVNGVVLHLEGGNSTLNGKAIDLVTNDLGMYDITLKVKPIFNEAIYNSLIVAEINGVVYTAKSVEPVKKTQNGVTVTKSKGAAYMIFMPVYGISLNGVNSEYKLDYQNRVFYVTDKDVATIKNSINNKDSYKFRVTTNGEDLAEVKTGALLMYSSYSLYRVALKDDINGDGTTDITDLVRLQEVQDGEVSLTMAEKYSVGINETGIVTENTLSNMRGTLLK